MAAMTRDVGHPSSRAKAATPQIPGELSSGTGLFVSLLIASCERELIAGLYRSLLTAPQAAWMTCCNWFRSKDNIPAARAR
jgi:hypothetical protein